MGRSAEVHDPDTTELAEQVRALVSRELGVRLDRVKMSSRLEEDFGTTGDDEWDFLEVFAREFAVDLSELDFHRHFGPEGCNPFWVFFPPAWLRELGRHPVTVDHLVRVAGMGRWVSPPRVG